MNSLGQKKRSCQLHLQQSSLRQGTSVLHSKITSTYTQNKKKKKHKLSGGKRKVSLEFTPRGHIQESPCVTVQVANTREDDTIFGNTFFFSFFLLGLGARSGITKSLKQNYLLE